MRQLASSLSVQRVGWFAVRALLVLELETLDKCLLLRPVLAHHSSNSHRTYFDNRYLAVCVDEISLDNAAVAHNACEPSWPSELPVCKSPRDSRKTPRISRSVNRQVLPYPIHPRGTQAHAQVASEISHVNAAATSSCARWSLQYRAG